MLVSIGMASVEALGYCLTQGEGEALSFMEFAHRYSAACFVLLIAVVLVWVIARFFLVWLGGVRPGIALLCARVLHDLRSGDGGLRPPL
jgi:hypothetical protein